ncbi:MAG: 23S rRNA (uridine(2552)-2'-O)-methyltransferase RlmE [Gammaproteobacteria bacterium]|nr:MAG: 23S rRNA (uridine(2552)-2'-O)-methyltransferase RlmE [Gammaproteobacteria bacterium]
MARTSSSKRWLRRQGSDDYVRRAKAEGWRSRAVYKLIEFHERECLFRSGQQVLDLGAAPGAWSQYAARAVGPRGHVIAVDRLEMDPIAGVEFIQGDFREEEICAQVLQCTCDAGLDLVMSDMAPNISGTRSVDQPRAMYLAELALEMALKALRPGGSLVVKLFHGEGFDAFVRAVRPSFEGVKVRKPAASRPESRETYLVARNFR